MAFDYRWADQRYDRFPALAHELVGLGPDLIVVTTGVTAALAAKQATTTIPILAVAVADPVKFGLVASFARPGGNITGLANAEQAGAIGRERAKARAQEEATRLSVTRMRNVAACWTCLGYDRTPPVRSASGQLIRGSERPLRVVFAG